MIGDGVVIATPFGSTGYYRSVTRSSFNQGIGVAFNNSTQEKAPWRLAENSQLTIEITRETGQLAADNNPDIVRISQGERLTIQKADEVARLVSHQQ